ncbi:MAG: 2-isopropylmalate synthase [Acidobacteriota bacterium]
MQLEESDLIYDWNRADGVHSVPARGRVELDDETLRDGLQSPSVLSPSIEDKIRILHLIADLGIESVNIGLPGAGPHVMRDVTRLAQEIADHRLPLLPNCAARTVEADIRPVLEITQKTGVAIEVSCFLGSSPIRQYAENWDMDRLLKLTRDAVSLAVGAGNPVMYVTEDTTRAKPEDIRRLYSAAVEAGAERVCIADTVGHATPDGARALVRFIRSVVGEEVKIDWHGHKDRGLSIINALAAAEAGADRLHATAIGIGERCGNCPMELLLVNLHLLGWSTRDLSKLTEYCELVSATTGVPIPDNYAVVGKDAFRTGTGVHAAAIIKARAKGDEWLADRIYSGVPASLVGRHQLIEIGPMSGESNVTFWLKERGIEAERSLVEAIFRRAKESDRTLEEGEVLGVCRSHGAALPS